MAKYENIRALAKKQLQTVTESSDRWKEFLRTAAIAYGNVQAMRRHSDGRYAETACSCPCRRQTDQYPAKAV